MYELLLLASPRDFECGMDLNIIFTDRQSSGYEGTPFGVTRRTGRRASTFLIAPFPLPPYSTLSTLSRRAEFELEGLRGGPKTTEDTI